MFQNLNLPKNPQLVKPIEDSTKRKANIGAGTENRNSIN
ncbi:hypothetical protein SAMN05444377_11840 [Flavobacterium fontis]|uniref:Uncharacterized protein n=1 Tax=Flavobacterium fontis TaxID=1124188 RepID=A0A1M5EAY7_9FLAO|nr:hypothetical protein SAMN05444377_11840 [Flavobacterium fontis]